MKKELLTMAFALSMLVGQNAFSDTDPTMEQFCTEYGIGLSDCLTGIQTAFDKSTVCVGATVVASSTIPSLADAGNCEDEAAHALVCEGMGLTPGGPGSGCGGG